MKKTIIGCIILWLMIVGYGFILWEACALAFTPGWWVIPVGIVILPAETILLFVFVIWAMGKYVVEEE